MFGSYTDKPKSAPEAMLIGVENYRAAAENHLVNLLTQPFRKEK